MKTFHHLLGALSLASLLTGCAANATLTAAADTKLQSALSVGCPIAQAIQTSGLKLNAGQTAALQSLELACPPNPPPDSAVIAIDDIIQAYLLLAPVMKR